MTTLFSRIRKAAAQRVAYNRTVAAISAMPIEIAVEDLGIYPGDARAIAARSVYGR